MYTITTDLYTIVYRYILYKFIYIPLHFIIYTNSYIIDLPYIDMTPFYIKEKGKLALAPPFPDTGESAANRTGSCFYVPVSISAPPKRIINL